MGFFIIDEGDATVTSGGNELAKLGPGQYFGELALIDEGTHGDDHGRHGAPLLRAHLLGVPTAGRGQLADRVEASAGAREAAPRGAARPRATFRATPESEEILSRPGRVAKLVQLGTR